ncbi:MAG: NYN domain-containing protein [Devosiaceae bacterium]|nr:NYN domain-containing protein [Devosiaceae bacterium]
MELDPLDKVVVFIDGANLYATAKAIGVDVDYRSLLADFRKRCRFIRAYYFTAYLDDQEYSSIRPLIDWLDYNGYTMITKPAKEFTDAAGRKKIKGNMDIEIAVEALELAPHYDHMILFSGDGDFTSLVKALQKQAKKVTVVSTLSTSTPMIADELRRQADFFVDVVDLVKEFGRPQMELDKTNPEEA